MASQKKWIKSAFDFAGAPEPPTKRARTQSIPDEAPSTDTLDLTASPPTAQTYARVPLKCTDIHSSNWVENFAPRTSDDLAIHPKKIEELEHWLKQCDANRPTRPAPILLITGPSGSGKTATFLLLAKLRGFAVNEWINPVDVELQRHQKNDAFRDDDNNAYCEKQTDQFSQFLFRASRYTSLFESSAKRIVLVEDIPNLYLKDAEALHEVLEHYADYGKSPLVFIVTDTKSKKLDLAYILFGEQVRQKYNIEQISFNAVSATLLKKGLKRIVAIMQQPGFSRHYKQLPADCVDSIVLTAQGDIRNAVINLHFAAQKNSGTMQLKDCVPSGKSTTRGKPKNKKLTSLGCDESITMMHALGRVLNPKYQETNSQRLAHSPEQLADDFTSQPSNFMRLLHANYMCHFRDIDDIVASSDMLSSTDVVMNEWREDAFAQMGLNMAIRGVMVCNRHPATGWLPIKGYKKVASSSSVEQELRDFFNISATVSASVLGADYRTFARIIRGKSV